jgi:hypothetical protein
MEMYLRFVLAKAQKPTRRRVGILQHDRRYRGSPTRDAIMTWLKIHLPVPPESAFGGGRGLCWFNLEARDCIEQVRDLAFFLEGRGERVWQVYSRNPGLITYEDEFQIVAIPDSARMTEDAQRE